MIFVKILYKDNHITHINVSGHANSDDYGKDLVCAGVSTICTGICNELDHRGFLKGYGIIELEEGHMTIESTQYREDFDIVLETLVVSLKTIQETAGNYIKIQEETNYEI